MDAVQVEIVRLNPKPGEVLLVRFRRGIFPDTLQRMKDDLNKYMSENFHGVRVLAITSDIDVALISPECATELERALTKRGPL